MNWIPLILVMHVQPPSNKLPVRGAAGSGQRGPSRLSICPAADLGSPPFLGRRRKLRPCLTVAADGEGTPRSSGLDDDGADGRWSWTGLRLPPSPEDDAWGMGIVGGRLRSQALVITGGAWRTVRGLQDLAIGR